MRGRGGGREGIGGREGSLAAAKRPEAKLQAVTEADRVARVLGAAGPRAPLHPDRSATASTLRHGAVDDLEAVLALIKANFKVVCRSAGGTAGLRLPLYVEDAVG